MSALSSWIAQSLMPAMHARLSTPTLDDFDLSSQTDGLCVGLQSPVETVTIIGFSALILGAALLLIARVMKRRAERHREARFGSGSGNTPTSTRTPPHA